MVDYTTLPPEQQPGMRPGMGRLKRFDDRSKDYLIRSHRLGLWRSLTARMRTSVNHRVYWRGNQGNTSQCTAYGTLHQWEAGKAHKRSRPGDALYGIRRPIVLPRLVYNMAQVRDPWSGSETEEPRYEGSSGLAAALALRDLGLITAFHHEFDDIDVCARAIFSEPLGFGLDWHAGMMLDGQPRTRWEDAVITPTGPFIGGHYIAAVGYDKRRKGAEWELLNSWDVWGFNGRCYISNDHLGLLLSREGECIMLDDADDIDVLAAYNDLDLAA